jgi:uncharacterized protein (DUF2141 family)
VLERHPEPEGLAGHGLPLPGYVWLDLHEKAQHVLEARTAAATAKYEATLESLRNMEKAGWVELAVQPDQKGHRPGKKRAAAERCTEAGREALRLLGE